MDQIQARNRVMAQLDLPAGAPAPVGFLVEIVIASVIGWAVQKCLSRLWPNLARNPGRLALWRLDRAIRRGCDEAATHVVAGGLHLSGADLYEQYGHRVREAILAAGRTATDSEWAAFRAASTH